MVIYNCSINKRKQKKGYKMKTSIYDYEENISIITTPNGDKVLTMNDAIFTKIINCIYEAHQSQEKKGFTATSRDTLRLWNVLNID